MFIIFKAKKENNMKKFKVFSLVLLGSIFGLSSCELPEFVSKIPGLSNLVKKEENKEKEEKHDEEQKPSGEESGNQQGGNEQGGNEQGGNEQGGGEQQQAGEGATFDFSVLKDTKGTQKCYSFTTAVGTNSNNVDPAYNADKQELRLYIGNTITITGTALITSIVFDANTCDHSNANGTLAADKGTLNGFTWTGSATEVTFNVNSGKQVHINKIDINGGGEVELNLLDEFPLSEVQEAIKDGTTETFPIPEADGYLFELDTDYENSCYVYVYGGDYEAYLTALENANFTVDDSYLTTDGCYYADSEGGTLEIALEVTGDDEYVLNYYAIEPMLDAFPKDAVDAYLATQNITEEYPIPEGTGFSGSYDDQYDVYDVNILGGSSATYMATLESNAYGFTKDDTYYSVAGCYLFVKGDLQIVVYPWDVDYDASYYMIEFMPVQDN